MEIEADSTSAMETETEASSSGEAVIARDKRWSFLDEIVKTVDSSVNISFPDLEQLLEEFGSQVYITQEGREEGRDYNCRSVLKIWPKFRKSIELQHKYPDTLLPKHIGEVIMNDLQSNTKALEMIDKLSVDDLGFVALSLSQEWLAKSIHTMLKNGIDTWAPILPVAKVVVDFPSLEEKIPMGSLQRHVIAETLTRMLRYSGVHVAELSRPPHSHESPPKWDSALMVKPSEQISIIQRKACDTDWVIYVERKPPFIITKTDFNLSSLDMQTLRYGINEVKADWIVYVTPVRQQEYIEMCFTAAKLEGWIKTNMEGKWSPSRGKEYPVLTYAGYRTCSTQPEELDNLLGQVKASCDDVAKHRAAQSLGYTAEAVFSCVLVYTYLKNNRLADFTFNSDEMVNEEGNTFVYLLHRRADVRDITRGDAFRKGIDELKKASDITLEKYEGYGKSEERMLELHLLNFNEVLKESSMFVLPHMMCEYLCDLAKKFKSYSDFTSGSVAATRLLLCEATAVVMEKCFDLLGITEDATNTAQSLDFLPTDVYDHIMNSYVLPKHTYVEPDKKKQKMAEREQSAETTLEPEFVERFITPCFVSDDRLWDPVRKSRFEVFMISPRVAIPSFDKGKLFGLISVSDKYGFRSDRGNHLFEPDFAYVSLFHHEWCDPINMKNNTFVCLENYPSVPFSSSIEVQMELYVTTEEKDECFQLCDATCEIDLEEIWGKESNSKCGCVGVEGEDGETFMFYIQIKDAADASLEVTFNMDKDRVVHGSVYAYYGGDFSYDCPPSNEDYYQALLFRSSISESCTLPLKRSMMAVPMNGSLIIDARFTDGVTEKLILLHRHSFSIKDGNREVDLKGTGCSLKLKIVLKK